jgi:two-component system alkaline phosphatase synthesis response regulator PhoP
MKRSNSISERPEIYRVLIVDEDKDFFYRVSKTLIEDGFQTIWVSSERFVLEQVKSLSPHIILLEVKTPNLDGIELCQIIRRTPELSNIIVALLTKQIDDYIQISAFKAGCDDFFLKSIKPELLNYRIMAHIIRQTSIRDGINGNNFVPSYRNLFTELFSMN